MRSFTCDTRARIEKFMIILSRIRLTTTPLVGGAAVWWGCFSSSWPHVLPMWKAFGLFKVTFRLYMPMRIARNQGYQSLRTNNLRPHRWTQEDANSWERLLKVENLTMISWFFKWRQQQFEVNNLLPSRTSFLWCFQLPAWTSHDAPNPMRF